MNYKKILVVVFLGVGIGCFMLSCSGNKLTVSDVKFESIFGQNKKHPNKIYCLLGKGYLKTTYSANSDSMIYSWIGKHPNAEIIEISKFENMVYCWLIDKQDTLNNFLIEQGCFLGGTMERPEKWEEMSPFNKSLLKNNKPDIQINIDNASYKQFLIQIRSAERRAKKKKIGIWADDFSMYKIRK